MRTSTTWAVLKRRIEGTVIINTTGSEWREFREIVCQLEVVVRSVFRADTINYADLRNQILHAHVHLIPHYQHPVVFHGVIFRDENWGRNYAPYPKDFSISTETKESIIAAMRAATENSTANR